MYAVYEQASLRAPKRRAMGELSFANLADAVEYFNNAGGYAEIDDDNDAADVFTKGGIVLTVESL